MATKLIKHNYENRYAAEQEADLFCRKSNYLSKLGMNIKK